MTTTITATNGAGTATPQLVYGYDTERQSRNVVHDLIGGDIAVSLIAPRRRSGRLQLLFDNEADAFACLALHAQETSFTLDVDDVPGVAMTYVVNGTVRLVLDDETHDAWTVEAGYQEVQP